MMEVYHDVYWLDKDNQPQPVTSEAEYSRAWKDKSVLKTRVDTDWVSTVFLSLDHSHPRGGKVLFETMIFSDQENLNNWMDRCGTWEGAVDCHLSVVKDLVLKNMDRFT